MINYKTNNFTSYSASSEALLPFHGSSDRICRLSVLILSFIFGYFFLFLNPASAQITALEAGCDPGFMYTLNKKAEMEALRDVAMAQTHIKKPDSVFQLTCFDVMVSNATYVASFPAPPAGDLAANSASLAALLNTTLHPIVAGFLMGNFNHTMLGGYPVNNNGNYANHVFAGQFAPLQGYQCTQMDKVWDTAKCIDFDDSDFYYDSPLVIDMQPANDPMPPSIFSNISDTPAPSPSSGLTSFQGTRLQAKTTTCAIGAPNGLTWANLASYAFNEQDVFYDFRAFLDPGLNFQSGTNYATYQNALAPEPWFSLTQPKGTGSGGGGCSGKGILTGLVYTKSGQRMCDGFCPNPGCTYQPTTIGNNAPVSSCRPGNCT